ncbi:MAG: Lrp/AsnC family transcriptional regulator [Candidatus Bathyarchaeota archaeon]|nr:Lrp/AsnC family transcriptional regulator [Candidatus Bathyarchaeota archaeon]
MKHTLDNCDVALSGKIDNVDLQILNVLQEECRLSYNKIAARVQISVGTAYNRVKNLEAKGLLKGCSVLLEPLKLGYPLTAVVFVQAEGGHFASAEQEIAETDGVVAVYDVTGEFDAAVIAKFKDRNGLNAFIKHIAALPYVKRTITNVSLNTVKEDFRIKLP